MVARRRPTMKDVAKHANVSISTVSYVLNGSGPVAPERRNRVLDAIRLLDYSPNESARSLKRRSASTVAMVAGILLHSGRGGGLSDMFGGGGGAALASTAAERNLNRITTVFATIWAASSRTGMLLRWDARRSRSNACACPQCDSAMMMPIARSITARDCKASSSCPARSRARR